MSIRPLRLVPAGAATILAAGLVALAPGPVAGQEGGVAGEEARRDASRAWIGVGLQPRLRCPSDREADRTPAPASDREEECRRALVVETVVVGEPADRAGILPGDTILAVNGRAVFDGGGNVRLPSFRPGEDLAVSVGTSAGRRTAIVSPVERPDAPGLVPVKVRSVERRRVLPPPSPAAERPAAVTVRIAPIGAVAPRDAPLRPRHRVEPGSLDPQLERIRDSVLSEATAYLDSVRGSFRAELRRRQAGETSAEIRRDLERIEERMDRGVRARIEEMTRRLEQFFRAHRVWQRGRGEAASGAEGRRAVLEERLRGALRAGATAEGAGLGLGEIAPEGVARMAGAELYPLTGPLSEHFEGADAGLLVLRVIPGTLAAEAGLRPGDVVVEAGGLPVSRPVELRAVLLEHPARDSTAVRWIRRGRVVEGVLREGG